MTTTFYLPTQVTIGPEALNDLPRLVKAYGTKPLLIHGHRPVEDGLLEKVRLTLAKAGIDYGNMGQILPNPTYDSVKRGIDIAKEEKCDLILSLGGGSTLQCAKGIAYGLAYKGKGHLWDLWDGKEEPKAMVPVGAILTNPASGDELNDACVLVRHDKQKTLKSKYGYCSFALLDPTLSVLPKYPTMCQSFEVFAYLFLRYLNADGIEAQVDLNLMQILFNKTKTLENNLEDLDARNTLFWVGFMSHSLDQKSDYRLTDLANRLAFRHSLPKGLALSALFFSWIPEILPEKDLAAARVGSALFNIQDKDESSAAAKTIAAMKARVSEMGLATNLIETGLRLSDAELAKLTDSKEEIALLKRANQN